MLIAITGIAWVVLARAFYLIWERNRPGRTPSAAEERLRHFRRGNR